MQSAPYISFPPQCHLNVDGTANHMCTSTSHESNMRCRCQVLLLQMGLVFKVLRAVS